MEPKDEEELREQALRLPEEQRAELAGRLLESLEPQGDAKQVDEAWRREVRRRLTELDDGSTQTRSIDELFADLDDG